MIPRVLDIPDDEASLARWLDGKIIAPAVHEVAAELAAVHGVGRSARWATPQEVSAWLGPWLPDVLERGTAALPRPRLVELLKTPRLIPGLQELVFIDGGDHWQGLALRKHGVPQLPAFLIGDGPTLPAAAGHREWPAAAASRLRPALTLAAAASVLLAIAGWSALRQAPTGAAWGWNRPDALASAPSPQEYLENLAAAADEWGSAETGSQPQLAARLRDLLAGCDRLIAAPHAPLSPADRDWLVERCRIWRATIAGHLAAVAESHDVAAVRRQADATVEKLVTALRSRAEEVRRRDRGTGS